MGSGQRFRWIGSRFILGLHVNRDERGEFNVPEPYRRYARYWLPGDELKAGRALGRRLRKHDRIELLAQVRSLYANVASRADVEDVELQVHKPYMAYAHWMPVHRMLTGTGVEQAQANLDIDSMSRAAFICVFADEIARGGKRQGSPGEPERRVTSDRRRNSPLVCVDTQACAQVSPC